MTDVPPGFEVHTVSVEPGCDRIYHEREWLDACKGGKVKPGGNFEFSGMVTETLLLGNLAVRTGQRLEWDRANLKVPNSEGVPNLAPGATITVGWKKEDCRALDAF